MVMKRSSDAETLAKSKRVRSQRDFDDNGVRDRLSSPESARDSGSPSRRSSSLTRKADTRTYKRSANVNMRTENNYQNQRKRTDRDLDPQIRLSNLPIHVGDNAMKQGIIHEFKKFLGSVDIPVHLYGRDEDRYGVVCFRTFDDAREAKRAIERRGRLSLFERPVVVNYDFPERTSRRSFSPPNDYPQNYNRALSPTRRAPRNTPQYDVDRNRGENDRKNFRSTGAYGQQNTIRPTEYIPPEDDPKATRTLFVGNLETSISSQELRRAFERFGDVLDVDIKRPARGQGNTYAFVKFADLDVAAKARVEMQGEIIGRNRVKIGYGKSQQTTRLWVGGLGQWTSIVELEREFDRFGAIRHIDYEKGDDHAYILYDSLDAASVAAREMRGFPLGGRDRRLKIDFADKDHLQDPRLRQAASPPRNRMNNIDGRVDDALFPVDQVERTYESDRVYERKREPSPYRRDSHPVNESDFRNWREESNPFKQDIGRQQDLPPQRTYGSSNSWPRDEHNMRNDDSENWERRSQERSSRGQQRYRQRPPNEDNYQPFDHSPLPSREVESNRTRKRRPPSPPRNKDYRDSGSPPKRRRSPRNRSPSPNHSNHSRPTSPSGSLRSSSLDGRFNRTSAGNDDEKRKGNLIDSNGNQNSSNKEDSDKDGQPKESAIQESVNPVSAGTETLQDLVKRFAVAWRGALILKSSAFPVRMHFIGGNPEVADSLLRSDQSGSSQSSVLKITQRLRLDQPKLEEVTRRINTAGASGHCLLLALPGVQTSLPEDTSTEEALQHRPLRNLMTYLKQKQAAAVVNLPVIPGNPATSKDDVGVLHAFPPCQFSHEHLVRIAPHLSPEPSKEDHLVILVIRGSG
ncbi:RNA-binding protein 15-like [Acropora millepora]|uniref:RNA-binding protein 15-like n=1 Tax=Acropora millepora TaxID=45264 RepID=UPI001CF1F50F|nr:RNA-binding protein 15-like [Acropora millepora]